MTDIDQRVAALEAHNGNHKDDIREIKGMVAKLVETSSAQTSILETVRDRLENGQKKMESLAVRVADVEAWQGKKDGQLSIIKWVLGLLSFGNLIALGKALLGGATLLK